MRVTVRKWGNSASVRIPAAILRSARLTLNAVVDVREEDGNIIIAHIDEAKVDLADLLAAITPANTHSDADFGPPQGRELL